MLVAKMNGIALPFSIREPIRELVAEIEESLGEMILLREGNFDRFDEHASAQGGFDEWIPFIMINRRLRDQFDEHALAHELLHIRRLINGAFSLETPETVAGVCGNGSDNRKAFANDVSNQIEHVAIFPQLECLGFDPHVQAEQWKQRQIEQLAKAQKDKFGPVDISWLAIHVGVSVFLGKSTMVQRAYIDAISALSPESIERGKEVSALIRRLGIAKPYNLERLYRMMLRSTGVPKGALLLKKLNFRSKSETRDPIP